MKKTSIIKQLKATITERINETENALNARRQDYLERTRHDEKDGAMHYLSQEIENLSSLLSRLDQTLNSLHTTENIRAYQCRIEEEPTILLAIQLCVPACFKYQGFTVQTANPKLPLIKSIETALANGETSFIIRDQTTGKPMKNADELQILS